MVSEKQMKIIALARRLDSPETMKVWRDYRDWLFLTAKLSTGDKIIPIIETKFR